MDTSHGYVYGLADPDTMETRYVGETEDLIVRRLHYHCVEGASESARLPIHLWVRDLIASGKQPIVYLLETVIQTGDAKADKRLRWEAERFWKRTLRDRGARLLNATPGRRKGQTFAEGIGPRKLKGRKRPELSEKLRGRSISDSHRESLRRSNAARWERERSEGTVDDPEVKARRSAAAKTAWATRRSKTPRRTA